MGQCAATITNSKEEVLTYPLKNTRQNRNQMNKFHINVVEAFKPVIIAVGCKGKFKVTRKIQGPKKKFVYREYGYHDPSVYP